MKYRQLQGNGRPQLSRYGNATADALDEQGKFDTSHSSSNGRLQGHAPADASEGRGISSCLAHVLLSMGNEASVFIQYFHSLG